MLENTAYLAIPWPSLTVHSSSRVCFTEIISQRYHVLIRRSWDNCHSGGPPTDSTVKMDAPSHIVKVTCGESHGILFSMYGSKNSAGPKHQSRHLSAMWLELGWAGCDISSPTNNPSVRWKLSNLENKDNKAGDTDLATYTSPSE